MSDQPNAPPPGEGEPAPAPAPAPVGSEPAPVSSEPSEPSEQTPEQAAEKSRGDRRFAELTAKLSAAQRDRDRLAAETEFLRRNIQQPQQGQDTPEARYMREREAIRAEVETKIRTETFHEQGASQFPDWRQRCDDLVKMGADPNFAQLLVEMPEGVKVAAALAGDPAEVERIANLRTERARAVALGKYAATVEDAPGRTAAPRPVTNAPAPIRPVTGRASPAFNEYAADAQSLVDKYMRDDLAKRTRH